MQKRKTQRGNAGLQGEFIFVYSPSSLTGHNSQAILCGYRIDGNSNVLPTWRRYHA